MFTNLLTYYSNPVVLEQILSHAKNREVSVALENGGHMTRPNVLVYERDILELVRKGATSFHGTVEHWKNPLLLRTGISSADMKDLRTGWDMIIDIDSSIGLDASKLAALRVLDLLRSYGVEATVKFSGNRGFHIGVPWESLPKTIDYEPATHQFPKVPRIVASYIKETVKDRLFADLKKSKGSLHELMEELGDVQATTLSPYLFVDIESNWGERHLFRLPYSLNEKTWLASVPLARTELDSFKIEYASPERAVKYKPQGFLAPGGDADSLVVAAMDWHASRVKEERKETTKHVKRTKEVPESVFPPCIKLIMGGLADGRKRSVLVLVNFLQQMNWPWEKIDAAVREANAKNKPPLSDTYVNTQLNWFRRSAETGRSLLPPNCANDAFYTGYNICQPDERCKRGTETIQIKNPVSYPFAGVSRKLIKG
ncbi:MAG: hypothetical protein HYS81_01090 [Candidatus Aenigmatarchaeota archaeon]|nr:MAG: hypothetical protein HYS81_01090 [Candidatus Aenigmarchaeota archaeon]